MELEPTVTSLVAFLVLAVFCGWRGARPSDLARGVRMMPWRPLMVVFSLGVLLMLVHLANLAGIKTGR